MRNLKIKSLALGVAAAALVGGVAHADQILINPGVAWYMNDADRGLKNREAYVLGLEYIYADRFGVEVSGSFSQPKWKAANRGLGEDPDHIAYDANLLYYFGKSGDRLRPYAAFGVGDGRWEFDNTDWVETDVNLGGGVRYELAKNVSLRADARVVHGTDESTFDGRALLGVSYAFNVGPDRTKKAAAPVAEPAPVVEEPRDSDGDGVLDSADRCPNTRAGAKVDANGCELVKTVMESIRLNVQFATGSSAVAPRYHAEVQKIADFMKKYPDLTVTIEGHTDNTGGAALNERLSSARANSVREELVNRFGVAANRVTSVGYGPSRPVASNATAAGRQENRRVVAVLEKEVSAGQ
ncbi:outer membrane porin f precursor [gamma proteobacterium HdN1]|nr:outer membrane porin f precursor [gamma proteobacterium HdN1]